MPAYIAPLDTAGLKVVGGYDANKELGLPYIKANVVVTDPRTGVLRAMVSGDYINDVRTGAQPAIMVKLLAACTDVVCFIGTGMLDVACAGLLLQKIEESGEELFRFDMTK